MDILAFFEFFGKIGIGTGGSYCRSDIEKYFITPPSSVDDEDFAAF
jgi:hypothetical protein